MKLKAQIIALLDTQPELTYVQIAERLGCIDNYVYRVAQLIGVRRGHQGKLTKADRVAVTEAIRAGISQKSLARQYQVSPATISKHAKKCGLTRNARLQRLEPQGHPASREGSQAPGDSTS